MVEGWEPTFRIFPFLSNLNGKSERGCVSALVLSAANLLGNQSVMVVFALPDQHCREFHWGLILRTGRLAESIAVPAQEAFYF